MKQLIATIFATILLTNFSMGQNLITAFTKAGKVFVQYDNGVSKEIVSAGENSIIAFSRAKKFVIYDKIEQKSKTKYGYNQLSVHCFNLTSNKDTILFTTCLDGVGGTKLDYPTNIYPNSNLCGIDTGMLSNDEERLYFQTSGWAVCPAIFYYSLRENKLVFFIAGWLNKITKEGIEVEITGIEWNKKGESEGRYTQLCLFDLNGNLIKKLAPKEF
jgi:hypothetical protein